MKKHFKIIIYSAIIIVTLVLFAVSRYTTAEKIYIDTSDDTNVNYIEIDGVEQFFYVDHDMKNVAMKFCFTYMGTISLNDQIAIEIYDKNGFMISEKRFFPIYITANEMTGAFTFENVNLSGGDWYSVRIHSDVQNATMYAWVVSDSQDDRIYIEAFDNIQDYNLKMVIGE